LSEESEYAWDLHRKIGSAGIVCQSFAATGPFGSFHVTPVDGGAALMVAAFDRKKSQARAVVVDQSGRFASEAWPLECPLSTEKPDAR
jgi:hypothetical protein